ncbi:intersectin-EH binding protein Ibp1 [Mycobacterium sp. 3519A]|uniref:intersectin-EH binding protein Ibp1 n=1 Tax=Mycobacterium sp. 3519A TaxID=2057184 RepID=UPI000C7C7B0F|nr:intersectin-EH binding protein Ibp1 [Mycobacterium sp. 3519A]
MTLQLSSRRSILLGAFALAVAAAPAVAAVGVSSTLTHVAECPPGYVTEETSGACVMGGAPAGGESAVPGNPAMPEVDGIPCTGANTGECIGLQESQGGGAAPIP